MVDQHPESDSDPGRHGRRRSPYRRLPPDRRREEILDVAAELFGRQGEQAVSIDAIATAAGTSRNSIYRCFGTKRRLYLAAMGALGAKLSEGQAEPAAGTPSQQLATRLTRYFDVIQKYQPGYAALVSMGAPGQPEETRAAIGELRRHAYHGIYEGIGVTEPTPVLEASVHAWVATMEWMGLEWLQNRHMPREELESLLSMFLGLMLVGAASHDSTAADRLLRYIEAESPGSPFAVHLARAGDLMSMKLFSRLTGMLLTGAAADGAGTGPPETRAVPRQSPPVPVEASPPAPQGRSHQQDL